MTIIKIPLSISVHSMLNLTSKLKLKKTDTLIVAVSGGSDSMALLHLLLNQGHKNLIVAHVDHQLRKESKHEAQLVKKEAEKYGLKFELLTVNIKVLSQKEKKGEEETGRNERYKFFEKLRKKYKAKFIVTAHHLDDQVETVLLNMTRGCGLKGLVGIEEINGNLWRPLILLEKSELRKYCKKNKIKFVDEPGNIDPRYKRSFMRTQVIPQLKKANQNFTKTFTQNIRLWKSASDLVGDKACKYLNRQKRNCYDLKSYRNLHPAVQGEVLRQIHLREHGHINDLTQSHLEQIQNVLSLKVSGKKKEFGSGKMIVKMKDYFKVT
jgi:tRNA(Ile)-lysidine synthase